ncbi:MAG: YicC/YloC family endoribonuclease [Planctomycetota bacterium]
MAQIMSMTGFGRGASSGLIGHATIEIKSVNHRSLKSSYRIPTGWGSLEADLRPIIETGLERGSVDVLVQIVSGPSVARLLPPTDLIDLGRLTAYVQACKLAAVETGLAEPDTLAPFLELPGVVREPALDPDLEAWRPIVLEAGQKARKSLNEQRRKEGSSLATFFREVLKRMDAILKEIRERAPLRLAEYLEQYRKRVQALMEQAAPGMTLNRDVLERETVLAADRMTIDEEITRLAHHIKNFGKVLTSGGATGKSLEFIGQEMLREANTIGSKSLDPAMTDLVVQMKSEVEKLKEQSANVE